MQPMGLTANDQAPPVSDLPIDTDATGARKETDSMGEIDVLCLDKNSIRGNSSRIAVLEGCFMRDFRTRE